MGFYPFAPAAGGAPSGAAGGSLSGTYPNPGIAVPEQLTAPSAGFVTLEIQVAADTFERLTVDSNGQMAWGSGALAADCTLLRASANNMSMGAALQLTGNSSLTLANGQFISNGTGKGLTIKGSVANCKMGSGTLAGGTATIANTSVTASSKIYFTNTSVSATSGLLAATSITPGTSFVVTSSIATDTSTFNYFIVEQV